MDHVHASTKHGTDTECKSIMHECKYIKVPVSIGPHGGLGMLVSVHRPASQGHWLVHPNVCTCPQCSVTTCMAQ